MLYDAFISHATEDKDEIVRPLAERLREKRVEVWYDEFTLTAGMSLRQSIDLGLRKSRYGIVILSPHFFGKSWPEWELNGLVQRQLSGSQNVILPVWHGVNKKEISAYSPSLADILAIPSNLGVDEVVRRLLKVIQPEESALVLARNLILKKGYETPVISNDWWLDVIENSGRQNESRWCFPVWQMSSNSSSRGEYLAWLVMQHLWQEQAEILPVAQTTPPEETLQFIRSQPGLLELCNRMPGLLLEFAPQLAIPGFAGELEEAIEIAYQDSVDMMKAARARKDRFGTATTTNGLCLACDECFVLRHPTFGDYRPAMVANTFVDGGGHGLGPHCRAFPIVDYALWLLSTRSDWLPRRQHSYLLQGMKEWAAWPSDFSDQESNNRANDGEDFISWLTRSENRKRFSVAHRAMSDLIARIARARETLLLPENADVLAQRFLSQGFIEAWFAEQSRRRSGRTRRANRPKKPTLI